MKRRLLVLAMLIAVIPLLGAHINRPTKTGVGCSGTSWTAGCQPTAADMNGDVDAIYTLVNGNIDDTNISPTADINSGQILNLTLVDADINTSAAIAVSKLDQTPGLLDTDIVSDYANDDPEFLTQTTPGDSETTSRPTDLEGEIERLRYTISRLAHGITTQHFDGSAHETVGWVDPPQRGGNLVYNNSFEFFDVANTVPNGWTIVTVSVAPTVTSTATSSELGVGKDVRIQSDANEAEGISQSFVGLKTATRYLVVAWAKAASGSDTCHLATTGFESSGGYQDIDIATSSTSYTVLSGVVQTQDPIVTTSILLLSDSNAQADDCEWDHVGLYEMSTEIFPSQTTYMVSATDADTDISGGSETTIITTDPVTVPGPGYVIVVTSYATIERRTSSASDSEEVVVLLKERVDAGAYSTVSTAAATSVTILDSAGLVIISSVRTYTHVSLHHAITAPVPGSTYTYRLTANEDGGDHHVLDSYINVEMRRVN